MITLKSNHHEIYGAAFNIVMHDKTFDGEMYKAHVAVNFAYDIQCDQHNPGLSKQRRQVVEQEIRWTQHDIDLLADQVQRLCTGQIGIQQPVFINLLEPEFSMLCFIVHDDVVVYISVGVSAIGPAIHLTTSKALLLEWAVKIKQCFYTELEPIQ